VHLMKSLPSDSSSADTVNAATIDEAVTTVAAAAWVVLLQAPVPALAAV
jgi:hypothetical protein